METMLAIATAGLCLVVMIEVTRAAIANLLRHAMLQDANCDICRRARREQLENPVADCSRNVDGSPQSPQTSRFMIKGLYRATRS